MRRNIGIVVDSSADFPNGLLDQLSIHVAPIHILINKKSYLHGINISNRQIVTAMQKDQSVSTSPPFPAEYAKLFEDLSGNYGSILSLHVSKDLSDCYQSANNSLKVLPTALTEKIRLIDTRNFSIGQALITKKAVDLLQNGLSPSNIQRALQPFIKSCALFFTVDNLYWLKRAGKLNIFSSIIGGLLDLKPIIALQNGTVSSIKKYRGSESSLKGLIDVSIQEYLKHGNGAEVWVAHADAMAKAQHIQSQIAGKLKVRPEGIKIVDIGPTITAHAGPGAVCVALLPNA